MNKLSCAYVFYKDQAPNNLNRLTFWTFNIVKGYNKLAINYACKKGYLFSLFYSGSGRVALNADIQTNKFSYSDMYWVWMTNQTYRFNLTENWRFYINALIDTSYYMNSITLKSTYPAGLNSIKGNASAIFLNTGSTFTRNFSVTNSLYFLFIILIIFNCF